MSIHIGLTASARWYRSSLKSIPFDAACFRIYPLKLIAILNDASVHDASDLMRASKADKL